jgi:hypothetical protein
MNEVRNLLLLGETFYFYFAVRINSWLKKNNYG